MAFNRYMHPRNIYCSKPDFKQLAADYPEFGSYVVENSSGNFSTINFKDPKALRALTCTLLDRDFNLKIEIPSDRLIPTLPLRLNYILWIEDLLGARSPSPAMGLDIGTGATCIYPLLGSKKNGWKFVATEMDSEAYECARRNVSSNALEDSIDVILVAKDDDVLKAAELYERRLDFVMCNPPFFADTGGDPASKPWPNATNHYLRDEGMTSGGELEFVTKMVKHSFLLKDKIRIYTTMLGKKQSLRAIKRILLEAPSGEIQSISTTEFCQGRTIRWGIAWTFTHGVKLAHFVISSVQEGDDIAEMSCAAEADHWSHQRRQRRAQAREATDTDPSAEIVTSPKRSSPSFPNDCNVPNKKSRSEHEEEKMDNDHGAEDSGSTIAIELVLSVRTLEEGVALEMRWIRGSLGFQAAHQLLQYFKNKLA